MVATPLGNLGDLSRRAVETLSSVPVVVAEDTRVTRKLLSHIGASPRLVSVHEDSPQASVEEVMRALDSGDVAVVTDAGTPGLVDPGAQLVRAAVAAGHRVVPVPGPSALTALLSVSGLPANRVLFLGFLTRSRTDRVRFLQSVLREPGTLVCYEAPHRVRATLENVSEVFGERQLVIGRELTKLHEEIFRGTAAEAIAHFETPRGEFAIAIEGAPDRPGLEADMDAEIVAALDRLRSRGISGRTLVEQAAAETGAPRSRVYRVSLGKGAASTGGQEGSSGSD